MKTGYIYNLVKSRDKIDCPYCGQRKCFAPFVHYQTNEPLVADGKMAGFCDHKHSCNTAITPRDLGVKNPPLSLIDSQYTYTYSSSPSEVCNHFQEAVTTIDIPRDMIYKYYCNREQSGLYRYLTKIAPSQDSLISVAQAYELGATKSGGIIFWQQDLTDKYHTAKIMWHNSETGKRIKNSSKPAFSWIHSEFQKHCPNLIASDFQLTQAPFGLHLCKNTSKNVCVVEAEKTAVIMSMFYPEFIWVAVCGRGQFKKEILEQIPHRTLYIYPDIDAEQEWKDLAFKGTDTKPPLTLSINKNFVFMPWYENHPDLPPTADPADLLLTSIG